MVNVLGELERELTPNERLLWSGRPIQGVRFTAKDIFLVPFALVWLAFSVALEITIYHQSVERGGAMRSLMLLLGMPFVLIGVHLLFARPFVEARRRAQTAYGITSRRVIFVAAGKKRRVKSIELSSVTDARVVERKDCSGSIRLLLARGDNYIKTGREQRHVVTSGEVLEMVPRVQEAFDAIQQARANTTG